MKLMRKGQIFMTLFIVYDNGDEEDLHYRECKLKILRGCIISIRISSFVEVERQSYRVKQYLHSPCTVVSVLLT